jgi:hypothetical protein
MSITPPTLTRRERSLFTDYCSNWTAGSPAGGVEAGRTDAADNRWIAVHGLATQWDHACSNLSLLRYSERR